MPVVTSKITEVMRKGVDASIKMYLRVYGRDCQIYLPKSTGIYSGKYDDVSYDDEPSRVDSLFIPGLFMSNTRAPVMGQYDLIGSSEYFIIVPQEYDIPLYTKIVVTSESNGISRFIIRDENYASTFEGGVFKRIDIEPLYDSSQDNDLLAELRFETNDIIAPDNSVASSDNNSGEYQLYIHEGKGNYHD